MGGDSDDLGEAGRGNTILASIFIPTPTHAAHRSTRLPIAIEAMQRFSTTRPDKDDDGGGGNRCRHWRDGAPMSQVGPIVISTSSQPKQQNAAHRSNREDSHHW